jgi:hypothetical protein
MGFSCVAAESRFVNRIRTAYLRFSFLTYVLLPLLALPLRLLGLG